MSLQIYFSESKTDNDMNNLVHWENWQTNTQGVISAYSFVIHLHNTTDIHPTDWIL